MRRTMNIETLNDYLTSANLTVMMCRAHADIFALSTEDILDAELRIERHICELEGLLADIRNRALGSRRADNVIQFALAK